MATTDRCSVLVVGAGPVGRGFHHRLEQTSHTVKICDEHSFASVGRFAPDVVLIAVRSGEQARAVIAQLPELSGRPTIVDLVTQSPSSAIQSDAVAKSTGLAYFGGGITGGAEQIRAGRAPLLVGPPTPPSLLSQLGPNIVFDSPWAAAEAKVLHNLCLVITNLVLGEILRFSSMPERLLEVLDAGTAGRTPSQSSAARDRLRHPTSSYTGSLASKDLTCIVTDMTDLTAALVGIDLRRIADRYATLGERPYTTDFSEDCSER